MFMYFFPCNLFIAGHKANISAQCGFAKGKLCHCFATTGLKPTYSGDKQLCDGGIEFTGQYRQNQLVVLSQTVVVLNWAAAKHRLQNIKQHQLGRLLSSRPQCWKSGGTFRSRRLRCSWLIFTWGWRSLANWPDIRNFLRCSRASHLNMTLRKRLRAMGEGSHDNSRSPE